MHSLPRSEEDDLRCIPHLPGKSSFPDAAGPQSASLMGSAWLLWPELRFASVRPWLPSAVYFLEHGVLANSKVSCPEAGIWCSKAGTDTELGSSQCDASGEPGSSSQGPPYSIPLNAELSRASYQNDCPVTAARLRGPQYPDPEPPLPFASPIRRETPFLLLALGDTSPRQPNPAPIPCAPKAPCALGLDGVRVRLPGRPQCPFPVLQLCGLSAFAFLSNKVISHVCI